MAHALLVALGEVMGQTVLERALDNAYPADRRLLIAELDKFLADPMRRRNVEKARKYLLNLSAKEK